MNIHLLPQDLKALYARLNSSLNQARQKVKSPLTLAEKLLFSHLWELKNWAPTDSILKLKPDRVAMQDVTAQMALLQFMLAGRKESALPATVHCDHLIQARVGASSDLKKALEDHDEVFQFLSTASSRYGIGFWKPGAGIIHQVILENYAFPGGLLIGTDSHTPNAGGLGMMAIGVGGADAADVMAGLSWEVKKPKVTGVHLKGSLSGWTSAKDIILKLLQIMGVKGGTNKVIEYFGEGTKHLSCTGKATITNMGAELGATCSLFPYDSKMAEYLRATKREKQVSVIEEYKNFLNPDREVLENPKAYYDEVIEINLSQLEPLIAGPHSPDRVHTLSEIKEECRKEGWPVKLSACLIGSCTNSSYEDIGRVAHIARQAAALGWKMPQYFLVTPGSELIRKTIARDQYIAPLEQVGGVVLANACGPCIGQWHRTDFKKGQVNTIINSFNRNFRGRNDANPDTLSFIASPELTIAIGLSGRLDFDPRTDTLEQEGKNLNLNPPKAEVLPPQGFYSTLEGYVPPEGKATEIKIKPSSERLQKLMPFPQWREEDFSRLLVLCKAKGKCTTDHISPAGFWLRYRGHLDRISDNLLLGAENAFSSRKGTGYNLLTKENQPFSKIARHYKAQGRSWVIIGDENYGEGSSREHAAMTPRFLGCKAVIAKSFARIHETNLKKQGVLALTFVSSQDKDKIEQNDKLHILNLKTLAPGSVHTVNLLRDQKVADHFQVAHTLNQEHIAWFKAGSALNWASKQSLRDRV